MIPFTASQTRIDNIGLVMALFAGKAAVLQNRIGLRRQSIKATKAVFVLFRQDVNNGWEYFGEVVLIIDPAQLSVYLVVQEEGQKAVYYQGQRQKHPQRVQYEVSHVYTRLKATALPAEVDEAEHGPHLVNEEERGVRTVAVQHKLDPMLSYSAALISADLGQIAINQSAHRYRNLHNMIRYVDCDHVSRCTHLSSLLAIERVTHHV